MAQLEALDVYRIEQLPETILIAQGVPVLKMTTSAQHCLLPGIPSPLKRSANKS